MQRGRLWNPPGYLRIRFHLYAYTYPDPDPAKQLENRAGSNCSLFVSAGSHVESAKIIVWLCLQTAAWLIYNQYNQSANLAVLSWFLKGLGGFGCVYWLRLLDPWHYIFQTLDQCRGAGIFWPEPGYFSRSRDIIIFWPEPVWGRLRFQLRWKK